MQLEIISVLPEKTHRLTPLLFVHGAWHAAWCWREQFMPYFARNGYMCYALSLRGHGKSENDKSLRWTGVWDYVADVKQVADYIAETVSVRPLVIGHSLGGYIVQKYLEGHDAPGAVLMASVPSIGALPFIMRYAARHPFVMLKVTLQLRLWPIVGSPKLANVALFSPDFPRDKLATYFNYLQDEGFRTALDAGVFQRPNPAKVRAKNIPMLVVGAANDAVIDVREIEATARAYGTEAAIIPDVAHDVMLEANWQRGADRILAWLLDTGL